MAKESLYGIERRLVFRETFESEESVRRNGGVINAGYIANKTYVNAPYGNVYYRKFIPKGTYTFRFKVVNHITKSYTYILSTYPATGGSLRISAATPSIIGIGLFTINSVYVDGLPASMLPAGNHEIVIVATLLYNLDDFCIGNYADAQYNYLSADFDHFEIYSGTLTAQEVKNLYENKRHKELNVNTLGRKEILNVSAVNGVVRNRLSGEGYGTECAKSISAYSSPNLLITSLTDLVYGNYYRITDAIDGDPRFAVSNGLSTTKKYRVSLLAKSDNNTLFRYYNGSVFVLVGTITDSWGNYVLDIQNGRTDLLFSSYPTKTLDIIFLSIKEVIPSVIPTAVSLVKQGEVNLMKFNGNSKIDVGSYDPMTGDRTFVAWISDNNSVDFARIISNSKFDVYKFGADLYIRSDGSGTARCNGILNGAGRITNLFMFCFTRTASGVVQVYKNGVAQTMFATTSGTPVAGTTNLAIGTLSSSLYWKGTMDRVRIIDGILTPQEINQLYTSEKDLYGL